MSEFSGDRGLNQVDLSQRFEGRGCIELAPGDQTIVVDTSTPLTTFNRRKVSGYDHGNETHEVLALVSVPRVIESDEDYSKGDNYSNTHIGVSLVTREDDYVGPSYEFVECSWGSDGGLHVWGGKNTPLYEKDREVERGTHNLSATLEGRTLVVNFHDKQIEGSDREGQPRPFVVVEPKGSKARTSPDDLQTNVQQVKRSRRKRRILATAATAMALASGIGGVVEADPFSSPAPIHATFDRYTSLDKDVLGVGSMHPPKDVGVVSVNVVGTGPIFTPKEANLNYRAAIGGLKTAARGDLTGVLPRVSALPETTVAVGESLVAKRCYTNDDLSHFEGAVFQKVDALRKKHGLHDTNILAFINAPSCGSKKNDNSFVPDAGVVNKIGGDMALVYRNKDYSVEQQAMVAGHEYGHERGLSHVKKLNCGYDLGNSSRFLLANCIIGDEYGDRQSLMGSSKSLRDPDPYDSRQQMQLGAIAPDQVLYATYPAGADSGDKIIYQAKIASLAAKTGDAKVIRLPGTGEIKSVNLELSTEVHCAADDCYNANSSSSFKMPLTVKAYAEADEYYKGRKYPIDAVIDLDPSNDDGASKVGTVIYRGADEEVKLVQLTDSGNGVGSAVIEVEYTVPKND
ncbi:MAG TPA: hypothetical protein VLH38_05245 [Patescibacteria group bacterium]|nr:hypothetical protein [Patescibacteria group bacterium]